MQTLGFISTIYEVRFDLSKFMFENSIDIASIKITKTEQIEAMAMRFLCQKFCFDKTISFFASKGISKILLLSGFTKLSLSAINIFFMFFVFILYPPLSFLSIF